MELNQAQLQTLCDIARAAGHEIMAVYGTDFASWQKDDDSPLTQADLRADAVIRKGLEQAFPGVFILSEESSSQGSSQAGAFFLVDPLDGTREFLKRNDEFTVNIAHVLGGEPVAGVVYAPALREMFYAARGLGAWKESGGAVSRMATASADASAQLRVIGSRSHGGEALEAWLARLDRSYSFVPAGSSLKFCRIAEGCADIYPRLGPTSQWDTAAAHAVLLEAGGAVVDAAGQPLRYGLERPMLNPHFVALAQPRMTYPALLSSA